MTTHKLGCWCHYRSVAEAQSCIDLSVASSVSPWHALDMFAQDIQCAHRSHRAQRLQSTRKKRFHSFAACPARAADNPRPVQCILLQAHGEGPAQLRLRARAAHAHAAGAAAVSACVSTRAKCTADHSAVGPRPPRTPLAAPAQHTHTLERTTAASTRSEDPTLAV
jgi:hypothetical protein